MTARSRAGALAYHPTLVLAALAQGAGYGLEVMDATGLSSGTVYPALRRLEAEGLVSGDWEQAEGAHREGRPARRYYRITPKGEEALGPALERIRAQQRVLGLAPGSRG